ncbi:hypothetical protein CP336_08490 [Pseudomonas fluorescens]|nr:hypothetical protein CP336_08490 [Pseudomonas fluorescens]
MSNQDDHVDFYYANEKLQSTTFGMTHGSSKTDYIHAIHVRNGTHMFFLTIALTAKVPGPGTYDFETGDVTGFFLILNNETGATDRGGPITSGLLELDYYNPVDLGAKGKTSGLGGKNLEPFKGAEFSIGTPWQKN